FPGRRRLRPLHAVGYRAATFFDQGVAMSRFALAVFGVSFIGAVGCGSTSTTTGGGGGGGSSSCAVVCYSECCSAGQTCNISTQHCEAVSAGGGQGGGGAGTGGSSSGGGTSSGGGGTSSNGGGAGGGSC